MACVFTALGWGIDHECERHEHRWTLAEMDLREDWSCIPCYPLVGRFFNINLLAVRQKREHMSDKMSLISAMGLAGIAGSLIGTSQPRQDYTPPEESSTHKQYRAERRNKKRLRNKSKKANRS